MAAALDGCKPGDDGSKQYRRRNRKRRNDGAAPGTGNRGLRVGDDIVHAALRVRTSQPGDAAHQLHQVGAVLGRNAAMAGGGEQDTSRFCPLHRRLGIGSPPGGTEQPVEFVTQQRLRRAGGGSGACERRARERRAADERGDEHGQNDSDRPRGKSMQAVLVLEVTGASGGPAGSYAASDIAAEAETDQRDQYQVDA